MTYIIAYIATAVVFFGLDFLWLGSIAKDFYAREMGALLRPKPNMGIAALFYLGYVGGIVYFAVLPSVQSGSLGMAAVSGLLLGLLAYGTYDVTNMATLQNWPIRMSLVDMAWGSLLTSVAAMAGHLALRLWN